MSQSFRRMTAHMLPMAVTFVLLLSLWTLLKCYYEIQDFFVPYPWQAAAAAFRIRNELGAALWLTGRAAVCGFGLSVVLGSFIAIMFAQFRLVRLGCFPYAVILQTVPIVAIAPLITYTRGAGFESVVLISLIVSLFPIIANTTAGLTSVPDGQRDLFKLNGATRWQVISKLQIPHAIPDLFTGMRTSAGLAVIGAIVGEFFAGNSTTEHGLGFLVPQRMDRLKADEAFAAVAAATLLGIAMFGAVSSLRKTLLRRWF